MTGPGGGAAGAAARAAQSLAATLAVVAALCACFAPAGAAPPRRDVQIFRQSGHIYKLRYNFGYEVTMVASVGPDGILLVDTGERELADSLRAAIATLGAGAPRYIINTHAHVDHTGGNAAWGDAPVVIAHRALRTRLRSGSYLFDEFPDAALPDTTFTDSMTLRFNGEEIRILAFPGAHDDNDAIVWFTGSKVVAAGDLVYANGFPSVEEVTGNVLGYPDVLSRILGRLPRDVTFVCGHSENCRRDGVERFRAAIVETDSIVRRELEAGRSVAEMKGAGILKDWNLFARGYVSLDEWIDMLVDAHRPAPAVHTLYEPMYHALRDGGPDSAIALYDGLERAHRDEYRFVENDLAFMADKLTRHGRTRDAVAIWGLYLREYPEGSLAWYAHYDLGKLRAASGDRAGAAAEYRKALQLSPASPRVPEMLEALRELEGE